MLSLSKSSVVSVLAAVALSTVIVAAPSGAAPPLTCGTPTQHALITNSAAVSLTSFGSVSGSVDGVDYNGSYEMSSVNVRTDPLFITATLDPGEVRFVGIVITYTPYNEGDLQPLETITTDLAPTLAIDTQYTLEYDTEFVRLESVYLVLAVCAAEALPALPVSGGSNTIGVFAGVVLLLGVVVQVVVRRQRRYHV